MPSGSKVQITNDFRNMIASSLQNLKPIPENDKAKSIYFLYAT